MINNLPNNSYYLAWTANSGNTVKETPETRPQDFGTQLLDKFKQYARITYTFDDNILPGFIDSAISFIEQALEYPIIPRTMDWTANHTGYEVYQVPFKNTKAVGTLYDFTPSRGQIYIPAPASWPLSLELGYDDADQIPQDLLMAIFAVAATFEINRGSAELALTQVPASIMARYGSIRC